MLKRNPERPDKNAEAQGAKEALISRRKVDELMSGLGGDKSLVAVKPTEDKKDKNLDNRPFSLA